MCAKHIALITLLIVLQTILQSASSEMSVQDFKQEVLKAHNNYRARHSAPALQLDGKLSQLSTEWAKHLLAINHMEHRPNSGYGENIYMAMGGHLTGTDAVNSWYNEIHEYNWNNPSFQSNTGHFTQVVWKSSKRLGVGFARRDNTIYVVCNYDPPGNYINQFRENVLPPK